MNSPTLDRQQTPPAERVRPGRPPRQLNDGPSVRLPSRASSSETELDDSYFERQAEDEVLTFLPRADVR